MGRKNKQLRIILILLVSLLVINLSFVLFSISKPAEKITENSLLTSQQQSLAENAKISAPKTSIASAIKTAVAKISHKISIKPAIKTAPSLSPQASQTNTASIDPTIYLDGKNYNEIAIASNPHPEDGSIQGATEINNGTDFAFLWYNGKVRLYHESELDKVRGNWNFSGGAEMINHYKEFRTLANRGTGIVEVPAGLWPGEYKYQICNGSATCQNAIGYTWGDIVVSDTDSLWFYTQDGTLKSRMYVFTPSDIRDIAYDKQFNKFLAITEPITDNKYLRVLVRNDKYLTLTAMKYCEPGTDVCEADPIGQGSALKILDMEYPINNMLISGVNAKKMSDNGNYIRSVPYIATNLDQDTDHISGMAYTNHYSVETVSYPFSKGFYLYFGGYDNGAQNPSYVTRFTAHRNMSYQNISYQTVTSPEITLISPNNNITITSKNVIFSYNVTSKNPISSCVLLIINSTINNTINKTVFQTSTNINSGTNSFSQSLAKGNYTWEVGCYDNASIFGISAEERILYNNPLLDQIDWLKSQQNSITGLVDSYEGDSQNYAYNYDQALAIIAFTLANETSSARQILNRMQSLQLSNGAWYQCYNAQTGERGNSGCNFYPTGDISWMVMAINFYEGYTKDKTYSETANKAIGYLNTMRNTAQDERYGSLRLCSGTACQYPDAISTENNYDAYSAYLYRGILNNNQSLIENSNLIKNYLIKEMWSNSSESNDPHHDIKIFWRGYNDSGYCTDTQTWGVLSLGKISTNGEELYKSLDWLYYNPYGSTRNSQNFSSSITNIDGFKSCTEESNFIWLEGTEGVAAAYYSIGNIERGDYFHNQTKKTISSNGGIPYSFDGSSTISYMNNWRYNSVASTAWYYFNEMKINPFIINITPPILPKVISSCMDINESGDYQLNNSIISNESTCINILANNVTLDLNGFSIIGDDSGKDYGVYVSGYNSTTIKNGEIHDFYDGIYLYKSSNNKLTGITANSNTDFGIFLSSSSNNTLTGITANDNNINPGCMGIALWLSSNNTLTNITANNNRVNSIFLYKSSNNTLTNITANNNPNIAVYLLDSSYNKLTGINASSNSYGIYFYSSSNNTLTMSTACSNSGLDLFCSSTSTGNSGTDNTFGNAYPCSNSWPKLDLDYKIC